MKVRSALLAILAIVFSLLSLTFGLGWAIFLKSPLRIVQQHPIELPRAAQFAPKDAALTFHLMVNPSGLSTYAEAVAASSQRNKARESLEKLREAFFSLAGIDFDTELIEWLGPEVSLIVFDSLEQEGSEG